MAGMSEYVDVLVTGFDRDEGTLVLFSGAAQHEGDDHECEVTIAVEHSYAQAIYDDLAAGGTVEVQVPGYLIVRWGDPIA
jgi:hypothetical protein